MKAYLLRFTRLLTLALAVGLLTTVYSGNAVNATWKAFTQPDIASSFVVNKQTAEVYTSNSDKQLQIHSHSAHSDGLWYAPASRERCLSMSALSSVFNPPMYALAIVLPQPVIPQFTKGFAITLPRHPWTLSYHSRSLRLNGWKESNLRYRFSQQA